MENSSGSVDGSSIENLRISTDEEFTVGIELGGSYSSIGIWNKTKESYEIIYKCRSSVSFEDGVELVGEPSVDTITQNTILEVTSFLGRKSSDLSREDYFPYKIVEGSLLRPVVSVTRKGHGHMFTPEELSAIILRKLKTMGETRLQRSLNNIVMCVPSSFGTLQRQATLDAAAIAGLEVVSLIDETTSIGVAYYTLNKPISRRRLIITHMGFFAFDISIIEYTQNGEVKVLEKCSEESLGLRKWISKVMAFCIESMDRTPTMDELIKLKIESERAIFQLSSLRSTKIDFDDRSVMLTREILQELFIDFVKSTENHVRDFLYNARFLRGPVKCDCVLTGAISTIPNLVKQLKACFNGKAAYDANIDISDFVMRGAAIHAAYHCEPKGFWSFEVMDMTRQAIILGVLKGGGYQKDWSVSIPKSTRLPVKLKKPLAFRITETPSSIILILYEGQTSVGSKYSLLFSQGVQSLNVCLEMDKNGILKVYAENQTSKGTIVSTMANHKPLSTEDIISFMEKAKRLDLELPVMTTEEDSARHTELPTSSDPDSYLVGRSKMNDVSDASIEALSRYTKMVDDVIQTQSQKIQEGSELAIARLNEMNIDGLIFAWEGQATFPPLLRGDVEAVQVSGGTDGVESELQKLQAHRNLNHELLVQIEEQIQKEAKEDEQVISQSGTRQSIPQSSTLANTMHDRLSGFAEKLKQAAESDAKIERSVRDHMALMSILDSHPIESALPRPIMSLGANEKSIVVALKQSLKELEMLGAQREDLEAKLKDMKKEENILPQLMTMTGSYEDLQGKEMLKYNHICEEITDNLHAQDELLLQIQAQNNRFARTFNIQEYRDSLVSCFKQMKRAIAKYREIRENINERLNFYATLQQEIKNLEHQKGLIDKDSRNSRSTQTWPRCSMVPCSNSSVFEEDTDSPKSDTIDSVDSPRAPTPLTSNSRHPDDLLGLDLDVPKGSAIEESNTLALHIVTSGFQETIG